MKPASTLTRHARRLTLAPLALLLAVSMSGCCWWGPHHGGGGGGRGGYDGGGPGGPRGR